MASLSFVLLSLAFIAIAIASPVPTDQSETTAAADKDVALIDVVEVIEPIPIVPLVDVASTSVPAKEADHKIAKRSALRGDNPSNDLLADLDGLKYENGLSSFDGRRIKFLPTWLG